MVYISKMSNQRCPPENLYFSLQKRDNERLRMYQKVDKSYHDCVVWIQLVHNARDKEVNSFAAEQRGGGGALKHDIMYIFNRGFRKKKSRNSCKWQKCYAELFTYTSNEGPVRIQHKCLVPIYLFPKIKLRGSLFPKQNYHVLSPNFHIHVSVSNLYIHRVGVPILLQPYRQTDPGNI